MLECARTFYNKQAVVKLEKHITSFCRRKEKKRYMYRAIETNRTLYRIIQEQRSKRRDYYHIIKLRITFNGDKLHRYD